MQSISTAAAGRSRLAAHAPEAACAITSGGDATPAAGTSDPAALEQATSTASPIWLRRLGTMAFTHSHRAAEAELWRAALEAELKATDPLHLVVTKWASRLTEHEAVELCRLSESGLAWLGLIGVTDALVDGRTHGRAGDSPPF